VNFHWDPVTAAVAAGWQGATVTTRVVRPHLDGAVLDYRDDALGRPTRVVSDIDVEGFRTTWLRCVESAASVQPG
jgi:hypothetical protein